MLLRVRDSAVRSNGVACARPQCLIDLKRERPLQGSEGLVAEIEPKTARGLRQPVLWRDALHRDEHPARAVHVENKNLRAVSLLRQQGLAGVGARRLPTAHQGLRQRHFAARKSGGPRVGVGGPDFMPVRLHRQSKPPRALALADPELRDERRAAEEGRGHDGEAHRDLANLRRKVERRAPILLVECRLRRMRVQGDATRWPPRRQPCGNKWWP
mmetsp:Transcript_64121/g.185862  ORF Transcript_64121/g.185862 Transcript_64121/m.185862 type:complete len:214 (-) Transcript_64121:222-863(-)